MIHVSYVSNNEALSLFISGVENKIVVIEILHTSIYYMCVPLFSVDSKSLANIVPEHMK